VDSTQESLILADPLAEQRPSVWQRLRRAFALPGAQRERLLELQRGRVVALAVTLQALALAVLVTAVWLGKRAAAEASAAAAVAFVDVRLDELNSTLWQVQGRLPATPAESWACTDELTQELLRASLDSLLVQRLWLVAADGVRACGPQGAGSLGELPPIAGPGAALVSLRSIATELVLALRLPDGRLLAAKLDPRALALPAEGPWDADGDRGERITLHSSDERRLRLWEGPGEPSALMSSLGLQVRSERHDHAVSVELGRRAFVSGLLGHAPLAMAAGALGTLLFCGWVWRQAMVRSRLARRIERALRKRQFVPFVQPIVDMATGRCIGGEVLMRWAHPERGILPPGEFIDEAERTGLIVGMSTLVMERAAHRLAPLAQAHPALYFSFNITAGQLRRPHFASELADIFNADTLPRAQVLLELTEREALDPLTQRTVRALHAAGWRIAIDDFGTGQSSLAALERLPIDRLKIDRAFVSAVGEQTARRPVLDAIIGLARELGVRLVAEGVETQAQWDYLAQRQVASAQGYLISRPLALDAFGRWFEAQLRPVGPTAAPLNDQPNERTAGHTVQGPEALLHDERLLSIWRAMLAPGGVDVRDRLFQLRLYRQCFVGREAVDWLVRHAQVSRAEALRLGRRLVALGCLKHVLDEHDFQDGELFYAVTSNTARDSPQPVATDLREALHGLHGPVQADHARGLLLHRRCLRGSELVGWLCKRYEVTPATALQWGAQLMRQGRLRHVFDDRPLSDSRALYRLT
jgi:EAL domain-containing protein (putative c-di-GMP-specific phosphodiesterase class I)